ncbi:hypothetical protein L083_6401 [Actinoplanes sp. N902-109]|nr:hypothetical protein L083_6401 [Actinoplanes sp. N902-109]
MARSTTAPELTTPSTRRRPVPALPDHRRGGRAQGRLAGSRRSPDGPASGRWATPRSAPRRPCR